MTREKSSEAPSLFYRLGVGADRIVLEQHPEAYSGLAINAQVAIWGKNWIGTFLGTTKKPYFIDPLTYPLAMDPALLLREENLRKSFEKLMPHYGSLALETGGKRRIRPRDLLEGGHLTARAEELAERVISFQKGVFQREDRMQQSLLRYMEILEEELPFGEPPEPLFLVPPYFHAENPDDDWYRISLSLAHFSSQVFADATIRPTICVSEACLDSPRAMRRILEDYADFAGVLVWVSPFDEKRESLERLRSLKLLLDGFFESDIPWMALYGGYFALCVATSQGSGVVSGICYGESKDVQAKTTGGGFPLRYYVPAARTKAVLATTRTFLTDHTGFVCHCGVCSGILDRIGVEQLNPEAVDQYLSEFDFTLAKRHFLVNRAMESQRVHETSREEVAASLRRDYEKLRKSRSELYGIANAHLGKWAKVISA